MRPRPSQNPTEARGEASAPWPAVLMVDDVPANLIALGAVLDPLGVHMVEARSGPEALRFIEQESFAVVLLDVQMPGMDGFETAERIRRLPNGRDVPILFITAMHPDEPYARRGYAAGAADYITKPFNANILRARVKAFVDLYRQREEAHRTQFEARTRELDEAQRRLTAFERISTAALETDDLEPFLSTLLTVFVGAADSADMATILLRHGDELQVHSSLGLQEEVDACFTVPIGVGFAGKIAATGRPLFLTGDEIEKTALSPWLKRRALRAVYGVPMTYEGEIIGVAHIGSTTAAGFSEPEKRLLLAMVTRAAWAVSRHRARERLYAALNSAPALISVWRGADCVCDYANDSYRMQFGGREVIGKRATELGASSELIAFIGRVLSEGATLSLSEHPMMVDFGGSGVSDERFFDLSLQPLRNAHGQPEAVLSFAVDLTSHVLARRALQQSERERAHLLELERAARRDAEIANRTKDEFLATVSHELRTPLNAILGWATILRRGIVKDFDRALALIERNAKAQARIVDDVLDLSRVVSGKLRLDIVPTEISHALVGAVDAVRPAAEAKGVTLEVDIDANLGVVAADADRIQQVVWNLLSNGVKFSPAGQNVRLTASRQGPLVVVRVADTGQGIAPQFLPFVFEPFRQGDASTTRSHGGLGLGLAIVKQLAVAHGGTVLAESDGPGKGATFTLKIPARASIPPLLPRSRAGVVSAASGVPAVRLHKMRVLVVDDEEDSRQLVGEVLAAEGALVETAGSADEALARVSYFKPDVLVSDIAMPRVDGYDLIRRLRARPPELGGTTPAIALTAHTRGEDRESAESAGFQLHIAKPVDPWELVSRVADLGPHAARAGIADD